MANLVESYGYQHDIDTMPREMVGNLVQRALNNIYGNQVAAALVVARNGFKPENGEAFDEAATIKQLRDAKFAQIKNGTLGTRAGGPRKDPVDVKYQQLLVSKVKSILKSVGAKWPKEADVSVRIGTDTATGEPIMRTQAEMLANCEAKFGEQLRREAEKLVKQEERLTKSNAAADAGVFDAKEAGI